MMGRVVGAIPNLSAAGVVASLRVVLAVLPSREPAAEVSPVLAVLALGVAVAPSRAG
jgi:hypothetical protein